MKWKGLFKSSKSKDKTHNQTIEVETITIEVTNKKIKNIHLRVYPPTAEVKISAPMKMDIESIRIFAISKLEWIKKQRAIILSKVHESPKEFISGESHYFFGKMYMLEVIESDGRTKISINEDKLILLVPPDSSIELKQAAVHAWYRKQLKNLIPVYIAKWEPLMNVHVKEFGIKKMRTKWGTCNVVKHRIWISLELAKKPLSCLEYIVVHEMVHLLERSHNHRFVAFMDTFLPEWRQIKTELNRFPVANEDRDC